MCVCVCVLMTGEESLLCKAEARDINSVAGVLKLYFRELREPLFPVQMFDQLIACSKHDVNGTNIFSVLEIEHSISKVK